MNRVTARAGRNVGVLQVSLAGILSGTAGLAAHLIRHLTPATPMAPLTISVYRTAIAALVMFGAAAWARVLTAAPTPPRAAAWRGLAGRWC